MNIITNKIKFLTIIFFLILQTSKGQSIFDTLTYREKAEGISKFWKEASHNFAFFDKISINWDSAYTEYLPRALAAKNVYEYYRVLSEFASLLKDGHTAVWVTDYFWKDLGSVPINFRRIADKRFVSRIDERLIKEIPIGTEVIAINNEPVDTFFSRWNVWNGLKGSELSFTFKSKEGKQYSKMIKRIAGKELVNYHPAEPAWTPFESKQIDNEVFYVKINTFADSTIPAKFYNILPQVNKSKFLIIDIRDNGGGNSDYARKIAEHLVEKNYTVGSAWKTRINNAAKKAWGSMIMFGHKSEVVVENQPYYKDDAWEMHPGDTLYISKEVPKINIPIVILTGRKTFSAAEDLLIFLDGSKNITKIGQPTAGSSGQPLLIALPKGMSGRICAKRDTYPDGREFINIGIKPDIIVEKTVDDLFKGVDPELKAAINFLKNKHR